MSEPPSLKTIQELYTRVDDDGDKSTEVDTPLVTIQKMRMKIQSLEKHTPVLVDTILRLNEELNSLADATTALCLAHSSPESVSKEQWEAVIARIGKVYRDIHTDLLLFVRDNNCELFLFERVKLDEYATEVTISEWINSMVAQIQYMMVVIKGAHAGKELHVPEESAPPATGKEDEQAETPICNNNTALEATHHESTISTSESEGVRAAGDEGECVAEEGVSVEEETPGSQS